MLGYTGTFQLQLVNQGRSQELDYAGERVFDIYEAEKGDTPPNYAATKQVLSDYFSPRKNPQMEVYKFRNCKQNASQSLDGTLLNYGSYQKIVNLLTQIKKFYHK